MTKGLPFPVGSTVLGLIRSFHAAVLEQGEGLTQGAFVDTFEYFASSHPKSKGVARKALVEWFTACFDGDVKPEDMERLAGLLRDS